MVGGPGCRKVAFGALASLGGAFGSPTTSTSSAALLLALASSAATPQPWGLTPPDLSGEAAAGVTLGARVSPAAVAWLPVAARATSGGHSSMAPFDSTSPSAALEFASSSGQVPPYSCVCIVRCTPIPELTGHRKIALHS